MKLETFFDYFDLLAEAPNGVQKLRELILDLAVRGKLVPQDENDEPAAVLLERIKKEKEQLVKEKKIKKDKPSQPIIAGEIPYKLPTNWQWTRLCEIGLINPRNEVDDSTIASFIPMNLIPQSYDKEIRYEVREWADIKKGFTHFADGDVVLAKITPCFQNRKSTVMYGLKNSVGAGTTELHVYRPINNLIIPAYVLLYLKSAEFINNGISKLTGTAGQKRVPNEYFAENPFPLPPLNEQHRIVAKVEELMKLCDELETHQTKKRETRILINNAALDKLLTADTPETFTKNWQRICDNFDLLYSAPENISKLRQTILQLAVMGKLVLQDANDEPAAVLLERIKAEKEQLIKEGKIKKDNPLPAIKDDEIPFELPKGWEWEMLGNLAKFIDYRGKTPPKTNSGVKLITAKNVRMGYIKDDPKEYISEETYHQWMTRGFPRSGDLLFTTEAPLGNVAQLLTTEKIALAQRVIDFQIFADLFSGYLKFALMSPIMQDFIRNKATGMTAEGIKAAKLKLILVPIPPVNEQKRIVGVDIAKLSPGAR